jgi:hypothetical protein
MAAKPSPTGLAVAVHDPSSPCCTLIGGISGHSQELCQETLLPLPPNRSSFRPVTSAHKGVLFCCDDSSRLVAHLQHEARTKGQGGARHVCLWPLKNQVVGVCKCVSYAGCKKRSSAVAVLQACWLCPVACMTLYDPLTTTLSRCVLGERG